ncbi:cupin domain protein [Rhexocercosporidium sp. MPI-PUGE-AT-0058]|nr:cupin domain protein [Rhexocercosporidium sp. MPI-PUGE-AT-0058]
MDTTVEGVTYPLPAVKRFITTHNKKGEAVFVEKIPEPITFYQPLKDPDVALSFSLGYTTSSFPAPLNKDQDLAKYKDILAGSSSVGISIPGGTVLRFVNYPPKFEAPMHRTVSLDYGVLIDGELECVLDSGERRSLKPGDVAIQRGTMHAWVNPSETKWARMYYVLIDALPATMDGKELGEDLTDLPQLGPGSH